MFSSVRCQRVPKTLRENMSNYYDSNRNARIASRIDRTGKVRTETQRRDPNSTVMAVSTDDRTNTTKLFIDNLEFPGSEPIRLDGRQARSLYRLLSRHYEATGKVL